LQTLFSPRILSVKDLSFMRRRLIYGIVMLVLAANLILGARIYLSSAQAAEKNSPYSSLELFSFVMERVRKDYVDGQDLSYEDLVHGALKGMLNSLDPHSEFMEPYKYKELQDDTQGAFGGVGLVISMRDEFVTVIAPLDDSPGLKAGVLPGDRIVEIDGKSTDKMPVDEAKKQLRGDPGTAVKLTVFRPTTGITKQVTVTRSVISVDMVKDINGKKDFPLSENKIGYVRLVQFGEKTSDGLDKAIKRLKDQGMKAFILDLRWNPGGLLDQAVDVCEKFLPRGQLVVSTEGRSPSQNTQRRAMGKGDTLKDMPMVVLVNLGSASASEIVAGCLQDLKRAVILGEKTFGKGSVQSIMPLPDGAALRLTTAKYYTPSHKVIHEQGITPDITVTMSDEDERDIQLASGPGGLEGLDPQAKARVEAVRDLQLERAMDLLKGVNLFTQRATATENRPPDTSKKMAEAR
jgi:carboxyl-terminal processing protease